MAESHTEDPPVQRRGTDGQGQSPLSQDKGAHTQLSTAQGKKSLNAGKGKVATSTSNWSQLVSVSLNLKMETDFHEDTFLLCVSVWSCMFVYVFV